MGFKDAFRSKRMKDPVDVIAQVVSGSEAPHATHGRQHEPGGAEPDGQAHAIECTSSGSGEKWPTPGGPLPVTVDPADLEKCKVRWDDVPESGDVAKQQADAMAAADEPGRRAARGGGGQVVSSGDVSDIVKRLQQAYPGAEINVQGGDASALGGASAAPAGGGDDSVAQLERLAKLKESGALSRAEFEREKARILGQ